MSEKSTYGNGPPMLYGTERIGGHAMPIAEFLSFVQEAPTVAPLDIVRAAATAHEVLRRAAQP
jgi:hypothetical protein